MTEEFKAWRLQQIKEAHIRYLESHPKDDDETENYELEDGEENARRI